MKKNTITLTLALLLGFGLANAQTQSSVINKVKFSFLKVGKNANKKLVAVGKRGATDDLPTWSKMVYWDHATNDWSKANYDSTVFTYDANGNVIQEKTINAYSGSVSISRNTYTLNAQGQPLAKITCYYNNSTSSYDSSSKEIFNYDAKGLKTLDESYYYNAGTWAISYGTKTTNTFDGNNHLTTVINENWDNNTSAYVTSDKTVYYYNANNQIDSGDQYTYNDTTKSFKLQMTIGNVKWYKFVSNNPDESDLLSATLYYIGPFGIKIPVMKMASTYDSHGKKTLESNYEYQLGTGFSETSRNKTDFTYDSRNRVTVEISSYYNFDSSRYDFNSKTTYGGFGVTAKTTHNSLTNVSLYPNPCANLITISGDRLNAFEVVNLQGQVVLSGKGNLVPTANLATGTYILKMESSKGEFGNMPFIKQ